MGNILGSKNTNQPLDEQAEERLWLDYRQTRDPKIRETFVIQYSPLVKFVAGKIAVGMPHNVEFDDLVGFGSIGLLDAIDKYDPERGVKFKTYAVTRIRGAIFDELRQIDWVPRSVRKKAKEMEEAIASLESQMGRTATDQEIANSMGIDEDEYSKTIMKISATSIISLNEVWSGVDDGEKSSIADTIEAPSSLNPDVIVEKEEIRRVIIEAIKELPEKEKQILVLYWYEDLTLKEIGKVMNVTESRVSQLHSKAMLRLRAKLTNVRKSIM